jgi:hypothetical protein
MGHNYYHMKTLIRRSPVRHELFNDRYYWGTNHAAWVSESRGPRED